MFTLEPTHVEAAAAKAAGWLRRRGLEQGDRVAVVAPNHPGYVPLTMGALRTGVVPVLVNVHLPETERRRIVADADPGVVLSEADWPEVADEDPVELAPCPLARPMHYTSGTTGASKGVWSGILSAGDARALVDDERELWAPTPDGTFLVVSPLYHSAPHRSAVSALLAGARVIVFERFEVAEVARVLSDGAVTGGFLVPTHLRRLLEHGFEAPAVRKALHAGEPCPPEVKERALEVFPDGTLWEFYGSTEGQFTAISPEEWRERPSSVGRSRPGRRLEIEDPGPDGVGRIWATCPECWRWEYWRDPGKTHEAWRTPETDDTDEPMFTVGDLGRLDDDGYLHLAGRREDLIISGGVNVYPAEVERVLEGHPDVVEAAVFGRPDPEWGQRVCAAVVSRGTTGDDVRDWARGRLAGSHAPKEVRVVEALPRTQTGKIRRGELAEERT